MHHGYSIILYRSGLLNNHFYIRPHLDDKPDATQYTPVFNGISGWQLYHGEGYSGQTPFKYDTWMHIKLVVSGSRAEIYLDDMETPIVYASELKRGVTGGGIGLLGSAQAHFDGYITRDYRYLGTIGYFDQVYLPLEAGPNELWIALSEDFGGWGIKAMFENTEGIRISTDQ